jgi:hypothetical protein
VRFLIYAILIGRYGFYLTTALRSALFMQRIAWTKISPLHFRGWNLDKLDEHLRNTGVEPLYIRALLPWPANCIYEETFNNVALMLNKHVHRLRALHIRAVNTNLVGQFLQNAFFPTNRHAVTSLEELDITVKLDSDDARLQVASVLQDAAETLPSLKSLTLPGHWECIPIPNYSSVFSNLSQLRVNGTGLLNGSPIYKLFHLLHHTPNLQSLFYKTPDQFSYAIGTFNGSWAPAKHKPVSLPVFLPHLREADVSATGSGTDFLRNLAAPNLERIQLDGSRIQDVLEDWHMGLIRDAGDIVEELSQRSPDIRSITLTELPLEEQVFKWLLGGEARNEHVVSPGLPYRKLEELIVRDMVLSKDQKLLLVRDVDQNCGEPTVELTDSALALYASKADGVSLRKLAIHRAERLSPDVILAAGRRGVKALAQTTTSEFVMEFMQNHGPSTECLNELEKIGVKVEWTKEVEGSDTDRNGWWTDDFKIDDCFYLI